MFWNRKSQSISERSNMQEHEVLFRLHPPGPNIAENRFIRTDLSRFGILKPLEAGICLVGSIERTGRLAACQSLLCD